MLFVLKKGQDHDIFWVVVSIFFLMFPKIGEDSHFDLSYFSDGLKPPTSFGFV